MNANPIMKPLGLSDGDRAAIIHVDDVGMCLASIEAFFELWDFGTVSSGLLDADGYFPRTSQEVQRSGDPAAAARELAAQADALARVGVDATHIDTHMGTVAHEKFMEGYVELAYSRRIPAMLPRSDAAGLQWLVPDAALRARVTAFLGSLEQRGFPLLDGLVAMPLNEPREQIETAKRLLGALPQGVTHFILHASTDTPELRAIASDWESRVQNYRAFRSDELARFIEREGIRLIGYRALRDLMRR